MAQPRARALPFSLRLRHRGHDVAFGPGSYVIGRHSTSDVQLDSPLVSRRHARIDVGKDFATVKDLHSSNGVWLNGERIGTETTRLHEGDQLLIGDQQVEVSIDGPARSESRELERIRQSEPSWFDDAGDDGDEQGFRGVHSERSSGTREADFFELIGKIVDRVMAEGRYADAETMLQAQMGKVLTDAKNGRSVAPAARDATLRYAAALAQGTGQGRWLEMALELLTALGTAPTGMLARELTRAFAEGDPIDPQRFARYLASIDRIEAPLERLRVSEWAREIERQSARRSR